MRILVLSPHYDDAPLSLGQSMLDGLLCDHDVAVGVLFGHSGWVRWFHPTRGRAPLATAIRRTEELIVARRFGYRRLAGRLEEATLRLDTTDTSRYLDPAADPAATGQVEPVVRLARRWAESHDAVIAPLGVGDHIDHLVTAAAATRLASSGFPVGFYADRPYATAFDDDQLDARAAALDPALQPLDASGDISARKQQRLWYPSQFDPRFVEALDADVSQRRRERLYVPPAPPFDRWIRSG